VHALDDSLINDNNRLFVEGGRKAGYLVEQFPHQRERLSRLEPLQSGLSQPGEAGHESRPAAARGTRRVEVVTRAEVLRIDADRALTVRVSQKAAGAKGAPSEWAPGDYHVRAGMVVAAAGAIGTAALLLRSPLPAPRSLGHGFTCHPALILVAEHAHPITNDVGHPKSYFVDHAESERFVLETCMYFPFVTAKSLTGFGPAHSAIMQRVPATPDDPAPGVRSHGPGQSHRGDSGREPVVHYRFTPRDRRRLGAGDPRGGAHLFRRRGPDASTSRRSAAARSGRRRPARGAHHRPSLPARPGGRFPRRT